MPFKTQVKYLLCISIFAALFIWWFMCKREVDTSHISQYEPMGYSNNKFHTYSQIQLAQEQQQQATIRAVLTPEVLKTNQSLSKVSPPSDLTKGAEVFVVSGQRSDDKQVVNVYVDRPDKSVVLVLSSHRKFIWRVEHSPRTQIKAVLVSARTDKDYIVLSDSKLLVYPMLPDDLPYAYDIEGSDFRYLLSLLHHKFGLTSINGYKGRYELESRYSFLEDESNNQLLTLKGLLPEKPPANFDFEILTANGKTASWTLMGPKSPDESKFENRIATTDGQLLFKIEYGLLNIVNLKSNDVSRYFPPLFGFPRLSQHELLAYDSKRKILTITSRRDKGHFFQFDVQSRKWLDNHSLMSNDIMVLTYSPEKDHYIALGQPVGVGTDGVHLMDLGLDGKVLGAIDIEDQLKGFNANFDSFQLRYAHNLRLFSQGDLVAIVYTPYSRVSRIWLYDRSTGRGMVTYNK